LCQVTDQSDPMSIKISCVQDTACYKYARQSVCPYVRLSACGTGAIQSSHLPSNNRNRFNYTFYWESHFLLQSFISTALSSPPTPFTGGQDTHIFTFTLLSALLDYYILFYGTSKNSFCSYSFSTRSVLSLPCYCF